MLLYFPSILLYDPRLSFLIEHYLCNVISRHSVHGEIFNLTLWRPQWATVCVKGLNRWHTADKINVRRISRSHGTPFCCANIVGQQYVGINCRRRCRCCEILLLYTWEQNWSVLT